MLNELKDAFPDSEIISEKHEPKTFGEWADNCLPGDVWLVHDEYMDRIDQIKLMADARVRKRNKQLRVWREGERGLACKFWIYEEDITPKNVLNFNKYQKKEKSNDSKKYRR